MYGVSEKAIRDVWTARTWAKETWHLEPLRALALKQTGRPKGRRDSKPRLKNGSYHPAASSINVLVGFDSSLDEQLGEWNVGTWCTQRSSDPFEEDWLIAKAALDILP